MVLFCNIQRTLCDFIFIIFIHVIIDNYHYDDTQSMKTYEMYELRYMHYQ